MGLAARGGGEVLRRVRVAGVARYRLHRGVRSREAPGCRTRVPQYREGGHEVERRDAEDACRPREVRGVRGRRARGHRTCRAAAACTVV